MNLKKYQDEVSKFVKCSTKDPMLDNWAKLYGLLRKKHETDKHLKKRIFAIRSLNEGKEGE